MVFKPVNNRLFSTESIKQSQDYQNAFKHLVARDSATPENINLLESFAHDPYLGLAQIILKSSDLFNEKNLKLITKDLEANFHYQAVNLAEALVLVKSFRLKPETQEELLKHASAGLINILKKLDDMNDELVNRIANLKIEFNSLVRIAKLLENKFSAHQNYIKIVSLK